MQQVVFNTTLDTALTALFAGLIVIVLADSVRVWVTALRGHRLPSGSEDPYVESKLWAPSGLVATKAERDVMREREKELAGAGGGRER
jgi:carbon starvation protein